MAPSCAFAWGFYDAMENGTPLTAITAAQSARGGLWSLPSAEAGCVFLNPAELGVLNGTMLNISGSTVQWRSEIWGASTTGYLDGGNAGTFTAAISARLSNSLAIGGGIARVADFGFNGINNVMEQIAPFTYQISEVQLLDSQGSLWEANAGISLRISEHVIAGLSGGMRFGSGSYHLQTEHQDPTVPDDTVDVSWENSDPCVHAGVLVPLDAGTFGFSATNGTDRYRSRIAFGFQKDFSLLNGSTMGAEFDIQSIDDRPAYSGRAFIFLAQMIPGVRSSYSVGFQRASRYHRTAATLATGARVLLGSFNLDMSVSWNSRSRKGDDFPDPYIAHIDDSGTYYSIGLNWRP